MNDHTACFPEPVMDSSRGLPNRAYHRWYARKGRVVQLTVTPSGMVLDGEELITVEVDVLGLDRPRAVDVLIDEPPTWGGLP
jgi:hypothetical protein